MTDEKIMQTSNTVDKQFLMGHCPGSLPRFIAHSCYLTELEYTFSRAWKSDNYWNSRNGPNLDASSILAKITEYPFKLNILGLPFVLGYFLRVKV